MKTFEDIENEITQLGYNDDVVVKAITECYKTVYDGNTSTNPSKREIEKILGRNVPLNEMVVDKNRIQKLLKILY
jgi:hypothetical protein